MLGALHPCSIGERLNGFPHGTLHKSSTNPGHEGKVSLLSLCIISLQENSFILEGVLHENSVNLSCSQGICVAHLRLNGLLCVQHLAGCAYSGSLLHESLTPKYVTVSSHVYNIQNSQTVFLLSQNPLETVGRISYHNMTCQAKSLHEHLLIS